MPIELKFLDNGIGAIYLFKGVVTGQELLQSNEEIFSAAERFNTARYGIIDLSIMEDLQISSCDMEKVVLQDTNASKINPNIVVAVIADTIIGFGFSRAWENLAGNVPWAKMVFKTKDRAFAWVKKTVKEKYGTNITFEK